MSGRFGMVADSPYEKGSRAVAQRMVNAEENFLQTLQDFLDWIYEL